MIRRMDVSATLKTFTALFALLTVFVYLGEIYRFVVDVVRHDFDLDESGSIGWLLTSVGTGIVAAFTPLAFIAWDWVARQPWRYLAAVNGALLGAVAFAGISALIAFPVQFLLEDLYEPGAVARIVLAATILALLAIFVTWMVSGSGRVRATMKWTVILIVALVLGGLLLPAFEDLANRDSREIIEELIGISAYGIGIAFFAWLIVRAVRHRIVLSGDRPRELFLGAIHRKGFWARLAFLTGLPSSLWNLAALKSPAFWAFLLARPVVYAGFLVLTGGLTLLNPAMPTAVGVVIIVGGHLMFYGAKRLAARYPWNPDRRIDARKPILFLRSFENDQLRFRRPWWHLVGRWFDLWSFRRNADEAMIDEIAQYGPVVALGMPGETKVPFGARRYYSSHDNWQDIVTQTARDAQAIVIAAGTSPGVQWEYDLLAREKLHDKTLLLFPPTASDNEPEQNIAALTAFTSSAAGDVSVPDDGELVALLPSRDGAPVLLTARQATASAYVGAIRGFFQKCSVDELADPLLL